MTTNNKDNGNDKKQALLICSRNTIDGVYPPLILSLQAVRAGAEASIFFTFMGIEAVKKGGIDKAKFFPPGLMGVVPGMPGMATKMMVGLAEKKANVPAPADLLEMCQLEGVKLYACLMTMDMMGLKDSDLVEGAEVIDAAGYMQRALAADLNLFI